jgi:hypothetical protein
MTKKQAESLFKTEYGEAIKKMSATDKRLTWNGFAQSLYDRGQITKSQLYKWDQPAFVK